MKSVNPTIAKLQRSLARLQMPANDSTLEASADMQELSQAPRVSKEQALELSLNLTAMETKSSKRS